MKGEEAERRLLAALGLEIRRHWGEIGRLEERLGRSRGYLGRIVRGGWSVSLGAFLRAVEACDREPVEFIAQALDAPAGAERYLRDLAATAPPRVPASPATRLSSPPQLGEVARRWRRAGDLAGAARLLARALASADLSRRAELLQGAAYVLSDAGQPARGKEVLREALELHFDRADDAGAGRVLVDRGILHRHAGELAAAIRVLGRARQLLPPHGALDLRAVRNLEALHHHLAAAHLANGDPHAATVILDRAARELPESPPVRARIFWHQGRAASVRGDPGAAGSTLRRALAEFGDHREATLVLCDLLRCQLAAGQGREALALARREAHRFPAYRGRLRTETALAQVARQILEGRLSSDLLGRASGWLR